MLVAQQCLTFFDPMDCSPPGSSVRGILQARILEWMPFLSPGIFPTQGWNPGLLHCRQILFCVSHQASQFLLLISYWQVIDNSVGQKPGQGTSGWLFSSTQCHLESFSCIQWARRSNKASLTWQAPQWSSAWPPSRHMAISGFLITWWPQVSQKS